MRTLAKVRVNDQNTDVISAILEPIKRGKPVLLKVDDARLSYKKRGHENFVLIQTLRSLGVDSEGLLVSLPPYGSEVVGADGRITPVQIMRTGLSITLSRALASALNKVYGDKHHGTTTSKTGCTPSTPAVRRQRRRATNVHKTA